MLTLNEEKIKRNLPNKFNPSELSEIYAQIIDNLSDEDIDSFICPFCKENHVFKKHGYYKRKYKDGSDKLLRVLEILRLICKKCRKTHALLLPCIVPYKWLLLWQQLQLIYFNHLKLEDKKEELMIIYDVDEKYLQVLENTYKYLWAKTLSVDNIICATLEELFFIQYECNKSFMQKAKRINMAAAIPHK